MRKVILNLLFLVGTVIGMWFIFFSVEKKDLFDLKLTGNQLEKELKKEKYGKDIIFFEEGVLESESSNLKNLIEEYKEENILEIIPLEDDDNTTRIIKENIVKINPQNNILIYVDGGYGTKSYLNTNVVSVKEKDQKIIIYVEQGEKAKMEFGMSFYLYNYYIIDNKYLKNKEEIIIKEIRTKMGKWEL